MRNIHFPASTSLLEILTVTTPILLLGIPVYVLMNGNAVTLSVSPGLKQVLIAGLLLVVLALFVTGALKRFPRWSLPAAGFVLAFLAYVSRAGWMEQQLPWLNRSWLTTLIGYQMHIWILLLLTVLAVLLLAKVWRPLRSFYARVYQDWTLLSFELYGATLLALFFTFDDYLHEEIFVAVASVFLAAGAMAYLYCNRPATRTLALFAGFTLAMLVAAIGKGYLAATLAWPYPGWSTNWQTEVLTTVFTWGGLSAIIFSPVLLKRWLLS